NHHIRVFDVVHGSRLANGRVLVEVRPGLADGLRIDTDGNIWTRAGGGWHCYSPQGELLGKIKIPEVVSNLTFGGPKRNRLFITGTTSLYSVYVAKNGVQAPGPPQAPQLCDERGAQAAGERWRPPPACSTRRRRRGSL